ncbi:MAG: nuclear transport factor 2 family protein [Bacteroidota bacterium]
MKSQLYWMSISSKVLLLTVIWGAVSHNSLAQSEEDSVKNTIEKLFEGMRTADSSMVHSVFASEARLLTIVEQNDNISLREAPLSRFLQTVGTPHDKVWDEQILDYQIQVDGAMAVAWTPYRFYRGTTFSHCGVNAFQLYQSSEGWKIIQITDTRRTEDCPE